MWTLLLSRTGDPPGQYFDKRQLDAGDIVVGRSAKDCDLVLPDEDGWVSRKHCTISAAGLELYVVDTGSKNGVALNQPSSRISPNLAVPVRPNDRLLIGNFVVTIATEATAAAMHMVPAPPPPLPSSGSGLAGDNPFGSAPDPIWDGDPMGSEMHEFLRGSLDDFLAPPAGAALIPERESDFGFADPLGQAFSKPIMADMQPPPADFGIPADWDRMIGDLSGAPADPFGTPAADGFGAPGLDPFAGAGAGADAFAPPPPPVSGPAAFDDPFDMPAGTGFAGADLMADAPAPAAGAMGAFLDDPAPAAAPAAPAAPATPAAAAQAPAAQSNAAPAGAGWDAFMEGAGLAAGELRLAPDAMRKLGVLYRQVVLGMSDLMQDRAQFKDEFRVERTQLSIGKNNPLKHLPPLDAAKIMLGDPLPGFQGAEDALKSAFEDLKKHQLAMLAGVQRALTEVFSKLSPAEIEKMIEKAGSGKKMGRFSRGADRWSVYATVFEALRRDATSNANGVMSVAFREGYEAYLKSAP